MKIIKPNVQEVRDFEGVDNFYKAVARAARICYASDKTTDDKELCERLIEKKHFSPFAHAIVYLWRSQIIRNAVYYIGYIYEKAMSSRYLIEEKVYKYDEEDYLWAINGRLIVEGAVEWCKHNNKLSAIEVIDEFLYWLKEGWRGKFNGLHTLKFKSFIVDTSIGCTREMNRHHDNFYICEQSTRYCNFSKDKFNNEVTFNKPYWYDDINYKIKHSWMCAMRDAEFYYLDNIKRGVPTDIARGILPLDTHTRAIYTATIEEWNHFIDLRLKGATGKPHGDIKIIAEKINNFVNDEKKV